MAGGSKKVTTSPDLDKLVEKILKEIQDHKEDFRKRFDLLEERNRFLEKEVALLRAKADRLEEEKRSQGGMTLKEVSDINNRKFNFLLRGVEEPEIENFQERKQAKLDKIVEIVTSAGLDEGELLDAVKLHHRLGRREKEDGSINRFRPIMVKLTSTYARDRVIAVAGNLRQKNGQRYRIAPDLSPAQLANLNNQWDMVRQKNVEEAKKGKRYYVVGREDPRIRFRILTEEEQKTAEQDAREVLEKAQRYKRRD